MKNEEVGEEMVLAARELLGIFFLIINRLNVMLPGLFCLLKSGMAKFLVCQAITNKPGNGVMITE